MKGITEAQFAAHVDTLASNSARPEELSGLLREDHPAYDQRGASTVVRMRGWVLVALARTELSDAALLFVLEELDTGVDAYLVAAAAYALRSYQSPRSAFAPFVMRALANIRYQDEPVSFESYGEYAVSSTETSPVRELLLTLTWLGPNAREVLSEVESLRGQLSRKWLFEIDQAALAIRSTSNVAGLNPDTCCTLPAGLSNMFSWPLGLRGGCESIETTVFEDQDGLSLTFNEFFRGQPSIVVFFYTRCNNPFKCSLTITKLGRVQKLLEARGLAEQIKTAAITYDPAFDLPERMRGYGQNRGMRLDEYHRMLRTVNGVNALRSHFKLGVNFIESLVNRHRLEVYVLDYAGRIATSFERLHWDEEKVVTSALEVLNEKSDHSTTNHPPVSATQANRKATLPMFGAFASLAVAFFPKCPICWAAYMSVFGIAGLEQIPYSPWLQPVLVVVILINLASVWFRERSSGRMYPFYLVCAGALAILVSKLGIGWESPRIWGVSLTLAGSLLSALNRTNSRRNINNQLIDFCRKHFSNTPARDSGAS